MAGVMLSDDFSGIWIVLGGAMFFYGVVAAFLYTVFLQVSYIVEVWGSEMALWKKLLVPVVMAIWSLLPIVVVSAKKWNEVNGYPWMTWQWCELAVGIGGGWVVSVLLGRCLLCFSWRRCIGVSLAIFVAYSVLLQGL